MEDERLSLELDKQAKTEADLLAMKEHIERSLRDEETRAKVIEDFTYTFGQLGLTPDEAARLCARVLELMAKNSALPEIEQEVLGIFETTNVKQGDKEISLVDALHEKLKDRAEIIFSQVAQHLADIKSKVIDYGAGDGQVTQLLHDRQGLDIAGVDVRGYKAPHVTVPMSQFDGQHVDVEDGTYEAGVLTNVLHHEKTNENILNELDRIVDRKLVVLETVPVGESEDAMGKDKDRTFMNDYLYNRLFHNADVPVPGTFETPKSWADRFKQHGWEIVHEEDLGFDQPTIKDRHYLFVLEKIKKPLTS